MEVEGRKGGDRRRGEGEGYGANGRGGGGEGGKEAVRGGWGINKGCRGIGREEWAWGRRVGGEWREGVKVGGGVGYRGGVVGGGKDGGKGERGGRGGLG